LKTLVILAAILLSSIICNSQNQTKHFSFISNTGDDATIFIEATSKIKFGSENIEVGDEIGIFTPDGICVGAGVWDGSGLAITCWEDDPFTDNKDGFVSEDSIYFRCWDESENYECDLVSVEYLEGFPFNSSGMFETAASYRINSLIAFMPPSLIYPENNSLEMPGVPKIIFNGPENTASYIFEIAEDENFSSQLITKTLSDTIVEPELANSKTYFWRVKAQNQEFQSDWSKTFRFSTIDSFILHGNNEYCVGDIGIFSIETLDGYDYMVSAENARVERSDDMNNIEIYFNQQGISKITVFRSSEEWMGVKDSVAFEVTVYEKPQAIINGSREVCSNSIAVYSCEREDNIECNWEVMGGEIVSKSVNSDSIQVQFSDSGDVEIILTQTNHKTQCFEERTIYVSTIEAPKTEIMGESIVCQNNDHYYYASDAEGNYLEWTVYENDTKIATYTTKDIHVSWKNPGTGSIELKIFTDQCSSTKLMNIEIIPEPIKPKIEEIDNELFSDYQSGNQWYFNGNKIDGATDRKAPDVGSGIYQVKAQNEQGCWSEISDEYDWTSGIFNISNNSEVFNIYPNPVRDRINIQLNQENVSFYSVKITNMLGEEIHNSYDLSGNTMIPAANISTGIFLIYITIDRNIYVSKVIVSK
jgi:hypothetical protein